MTCFSDSCRIALPLTPKEIKEQYTNSLGQPLDVFAETVGKLTYPADATLIAKLQDICWRRFRNRPIGDYDYELWLDALDDRVNFIWYGHSKTMRLILDPAIADTTTFLETITEDIINDKDSLTTQDLTVTNNLTTANNLTTTNNLKTTNNLTETVDSTQSTDETVSVESEDNPDSEAGASKYLSNRTNTTRGNDDIIDSSKVNTGTVDNTGTVENAGTVENTGTVKNTGTVLNADDSTITRTFTRSVQDGLIAERSTDVYNAIRKGIELFVNDLEPLFLNRW